jgi:hypothetical protein
MGEGPGVSKSSSTDAAAVKGSRLLSDGGGSNAAE